MQGLGLGVLTSLLFFRLVCSAMLGFGHDARLSSLGSRKHETSNSAGGALHLVSTQNPDP